MNEPSLYTIETNTGYGRHGEHSDTVGPDVLAAFDIPPVKRIERIEKPNPTSRIYRLTCENNRFMVRAIPSNLKEMSEVQCRVVANLGRDLSIKPRPMKSPGGDNDEYVFIADNFAWMVYPEIEGEIYCGDNCALEILMERAVDILDALSSKGAALTDSERNKLPCVSHRPKEWPAMFERIFAALTNPSDPLHESLGKTGRGLLTGRRHFFNACLDTLIDLPIMTKRDLVHNDLNHSNVVICNGQPVFLDIEDITFENRKIALAHGVFKLLRHSIYTRGDKSSSETISLLPTLLSQMNNSNRGFADRQDFFLFGAYRIVSEIYEICATFTDQNDSSRLFDLEKKVQNFFELCELTEINDGLAA